MAVDGFCIGLMRFRFHYLDETCAGSGWQSFCAVHPRHICTGTGLTAATSAPGLGSPLPHLYHD